MKNKYIPFRFSYDIKEIQNSGGTFSLFKTGELLVIGTGIISGIELNCEPDVRAVMKIRYEKIVYKELDILPVLEMPGAEGILENIAEEAKEMVFDILKNHKPRKKRVTNKNQNNEISED